MLESTKLVTTKSTKQELRKVQRNLAEDQVRKQHPITVKKTRQREKAWLDGMGERVYELISLTGIVTKPQGRDFRGRPWLTQKVQLKCTSSKWPRNMGSSIPICGVRQVVRFRVRLDHALSFSE